MQFNPALPDYRYYRRLHFVKSVIVRRCFRSIVLLDMANPFSKLKQFSKELAGSAPVPGGQEGGAMRKLPRRLWLIGKIALAVYFLLSGVGILLALLHRFAFR
jgi:hypothetical protein